jgi:hypothetical protein
MTAVPTIQGSAITYNKIYSKHVLTTQGASNKSRRSGESAIGKLQLTEGAAFMLITTCCLKV